MGPIVRNARLSNALEALPIDIGVAEGRIVAIEPYLAAEVEIFDADGSLVCSGFVETHILLNKLASSIAAFRRMGGHEANAAPHVAAVKPSFTVEDVYERAARMIEKCIKHGTTRMRIHLELDTGVEMRSFQAIEALRRDYAWAIDIKVYVFPQEGLTNNPWSVQLLVDTLKRGAKVVGPTPNYDADHTAQINRVFALVYEFDADIDMHLDSGNSPEDVDTHLV